MPSGPSTPELPLASSSDVAAEEASTLNSSFASTSVTGEPTEEELAEIAKSEILSRNADELDAQLEERPLAKKQEELQEAEEAEEARRESSTPEPAPIVNGEEPKAANGVEEPRAPTPSREKHTRKALLKNTDTELIRVQRVCICSRFILSR